jgi:hypothetical protein
MTFETDGFREIELQILDAPACEVSSTITVIHEDLTSDETTACQCSLEQYTKELIQANIVVEEESATDLAAEEISCPGE